MLRSRFKRRFNWQSGTPKALEDAPMFLVSPLTHNNRDNWFSLHNPRRLTGRREPCEDCFLPRVAVRFGFASCGSVRQGARLGLGEYVNIDDNNGK